MTRLPGPPAARNGAVAGAPHGDGALPLRMRIALARLGWLRSGSALLLAIALLAWLVAIPWGQQRLAACQAAIDAARQLAAAPRSAESAQPSNASAANLAQFRAQLIDARAVDAHLHKLYAIARAAGLGVEQAEFQFGAASHGQYLTCQVHLPLRGSYASVRRFAEQALREIPALALDEMSLRRDDARDVLPQARLRFTLYLGAPAPATEARP